MTLEEIKVMVADLNEDARIKHNKLIKLINHAIEIWPTLSPKGQETLGTFFQVMADDLVKHRDDSK